MITEIRNRSIIIDHGVHGFVIKIVFTDICTWPDAAAPYSYPTDRDVCESPLKKGMFRLVTPIRNNNTGRTVPDHDGDRIGDATGIDIGIDRSFYEGVIQEEVAGCLIA